MKPFISYFIHIFVNTTSGGSQVVCCGMIDQFFKIIILILCAIQIEITKGIAHKKTLEKYKLNIFQKDKIFKRWLQLDLCILTY